MTLTCEYCGRTWPAPHRDDCEQEKAMSRYDMNKEDGKGAYDFGLMSADKVEEYIDAQGGERRLDALMGIAEEAGVAADEVEMIRRVAVQLVKQAIRAAKKAL